MAGWAGKEAAQGHLPGGPHDSGLGAWTVVCLWVWAATAHLSLSLSSSWGQNHSSADLFISVLDQMLWGQGLCPALCGPRQAGHFPVAGVHLDKDGSVFVPGGIVLGTMGLRDRGEQLQVSSGVS